MAKNIRVHELAKELGMTNAEMMALCEQMGVGVKTHSSTLIEQWADQLRRKAEREGLTRPEQPEEPKPVKKTAKKAAKAAPKAAAKPAEKAADEPAEPAPAEPASPQPGAEASPAPTPTPATPSAEPRCW